MLYSSDICLKCSLPADHVSQAGRPFVRGLPAVTICNLKALCRYRLLQMGFILACNSVCVPLERKTRLHDMQKIRLGHSSLFCVCVCHCHGHSTLHCSVFWTLNVFFLSCLRSTLAGELCFLCHKCQTSIELNSTRSYHPSADAIANDCKKEI